MNQRATETNLNNEEFATLKDKYIDLIVVKNALYYRGY